MNTRLTPFENALETLRAKDRRRVLRGRGGFDFTSNDYLGLAGSPALTSATAEALARGVPVGATGSRLLRGHHPEHEALELEAAAFFGADRCLFFGGGYAANIAVLQTLPQAGDLIVFDSLSHASTLDGARAARCEAQAFRHNDANHAESVINAWRAKGGLGTPWLAVESLYSMDGDVAPLDDLLSIAERHDGFLIVDEAHATGVLGNQGRGLAAAYEGRESVITLHTCGKALGVSGALVAANATLIDFMINRSRQFIFATAPSPLAAAAVRASLRMVAENPAWRDELAARVGFADAQMRSRLGLEPSGSHIVPIILGSDASAVRTALALQSAGFDCRAIRPPTVPEGTARLRISLTLNVQSEAIAALFDALAEIRVLEAA